MFNNIDIILIGTLYSGNIGSVARAMKNLGFPHLKLVNPQCNIDDQSFWMATHGKDIINRSQTFHNIRDAIEDSSYIFGTTARNRRWRSFLYPNQIAEKVVAMAQKNRVSIIFGPEDIGLSNDELELCNEVVSIPTVKGASSMNISHAVLIICYEIFHAANNEANHFEVVELASSKRVEAMYDHMKRTLLEIGFLDPQNPEHFLGTIRRILTRASLSSKDVNFIRGVFRQLLWYIKKTKSNFQ